MGVERKLRMLEASGQQFTVPELHAEFVATCGVLSPACRKYAGFEERIQEEFGVDPSTGAVVRKAEAVDLPGMIYSILEGQPDFAMDMGSFGNLLQRMLN